MQHAADLLVAADDGVELAGARLLVEVDGILAQGVELLFGGGGVDRRPLVESADGFDELLFCGAVAFEQLRCRAALGHEP